MPGPANLYGVSNPIIGANLMSMTGGDLVCAHDTWTPVISSGQISAISGGAYYPVLFCIFDVLIGATSVGGLNVGFSINNGSAVNQIGYDYRTFLANTAYILPGNLNGSPSNTAWAGAGSTVQLLVYPFTQPVTVRQLGTQMMFMLFRAPDQ